MRNANPKRGPKWFQFEYWNWLVFYAPIIPFWLWFSLRNRCLTYFSAVNPAVPFGGFLRENKKAVNALLPEEYLPKSLYVSKNQSIDERFLTLRFPLVAKPNNGQRGKAVKIIETEAELFQYARNTNTDFLLQEYIAYPFELAVFYSKIPGQKHGRVSSITQKDFLQITGDGQNSIRQLMEADLRARLQIGALEVDGKIDLDEIPAQGEKRILEPIGNHCRGTKFTAANHLINEAVHRVFDNIMANAEGFYFGRFDLKAESIEALQSGKGIKILELNGVTSDPAHVFDPEYALWKAYRDVLWHWARMSKIARANLQMGTKPLSVAEAWTIIAEKFSPSPEAFHQNESINAPILSFES
ncbi:ATP-grasp domain-containing protein [Marinilongibacter aquaticus]|uniref:ATP-grasp domain-containing protein n=1 Tax=Marinilongibacter aquaticus TaxID=2975157 RepID=UPI0021BD9EF5|nr:ATP-grasp domain-containing protein [Marinilongibacter aquaticus]UBM57884.1 ATP-grasp domain-containing protein [Marinilongibacter aquaticus]